MRARSVLSGVAAIGALVVAGAIVSEAVAERKPAAVVATPLPSASDPPSPTPFTSPTAGASPAAHSPASVAYPPPRSGSYTYRAPGGTTVTQVAVTPAGQGAWLLDETTWVNSQMLQKRREAWSAAGVRVLGIWEASQPRPCVWSNAPVDVEFPLRAGSEWSVDASCRIARGAAGAETMRAQGSFRTSGRTTLSIGGRSVVAWLVVGSEVTTSDGAVNGHRYHTVDRTTTRVWFVPSVGLPGRTELTGTVEITSSKGTVRHPIRQVTQLESVSPR